MPLILILLNSIRHKYILNLKEEPINEWSYNFDEISTYLVIIKIMLYKFVKAFVPEVYFFASRDYILKYIEGLSNKKAKHNK